MHPSLALTPISPLFISLRLLRRCFLVSTIVDSVCEEDYRARGGGPLSIEEGGSEGGLPPVELHLDWPFPSPSRLPPR